MGSPVSLLYFFVRGIYYLLDKLVPLTVENDCQAFDFHYGAKKGQRRCEVGVKAFRRSVYLKTDLGEMNHKYSH